MSDQHYQGPDRRQASRELPKHMDEDTWRNTIWGLVMRFDNELSENTKLTAENTRVTRENTEVVASTVKALEDFKIEAAPAILYSRKFTKGMEVMGWIGTAAEWVVRKWVLIAAVIAAWTVMRNGGTWAEIKAIFSAIGK